MARLRIVGGDGVEQVLEVREQKLQIGRARDNDVVLPDPEKGVSRVHAELRYENGHYVVVDLQSQNGTWLNGRRVERADVPVGAEIAIGAYRLSLLPDGPPAARLPTRSPRPDPLDDMRETKRHDPPPFAAAPAPPTPAPAPAVPRWALGVGLAALVIIALAAVVWVSGPRQGSQPSAPPPVPEAPDGSAPAAGSVAPPTERPAPSEPLDLPAGSPPRPAPAKVTSTEPKNGDGPRIARRPGESNDAWRSRAAALQMRYGYSKAALDRGDYAAAAGGFEAILLEEPGFLDAPRLLVQAQAGLRASAKTLFEAGNRLDAAGDWMGALQKYEQARQINAGIPGLGERLQRVRGKLRAAGTAAFTKARQLEASGRPQEALREYEKAVQWLPADDSNRQVASSRIQQLKRKD